MMKKLNFLLKWLELRVVSMCFIMEHTCGIIDKKKQNPTSEIMSIWFKQAVGRENGNKSKKDIIN